MKSVATCPCKVFGLAAAVLASSWAALPQSLLGAVTTITNDNSSVSFDADTTTQPIGITNWVVDGVDHLHQQWFYYRIGSTGDEVGINTISTATVATGTVGDFTLASIVYENATLKVSVGLTLSGGSLGSNTSDLGEVIDITNKSGGTLDLHFFQYVDFDLNGTAGDDYGWFANNNTVGQADGGVTVSETVATPPPGNRELGVFSTIRDKFGDGLTTTLTDLYGNFDTTGLFLGPDDVTWAFQWNVALASGATFHISKDKNLYASPPHNGPLVPEPASFAIWGLGVGALGLAGLWRRNRADV